jgi:hypothetical protein
MNLCIIFSAGNPSIPDYQDELLFLHFKSTLLDLLDNSGIIYFGHAPDNTADGSDELLSEGTFFRIISSAELLNLNLESPPVEIVASFKNLMESQPVSWGTVIVEKGFITTETTIEFIF